MDALDKIVYGERLEDLLPALLALRGGMSQRADRSYNLRTKLDAAEAEPIRRALLRAEAELTLEDADAIGSKPENQRTYEQRAADALVRVLKAIA